MNRLTMLCKVVGTVLQESITDPWHQSLIAVDHTGRVTVNKAVPTQQCLSASRTHSFASAPTGYAKA